MDFVPPKRVFQQAPKSLNERREQGTYSLPGFLHPVRTKNGGMAMVYQGHPFPRKGFVYAEGVQANAKIKRATLLLFQPFSNFTINGFLESYLKHYIRLTEALTQDYQRIPHLHYEYYCEFSKATWDFTFMFLRSLGISFDTAYKMGQILATVFEYDDAYRFRAEDIMSESSKELFKHPQQEIQRLLRIFKQRDNSFQHTDDNHHGARIEKMLNLFHYLLYIPKVKRAFNLAMREVRFEWFQYDEMDYYWALNRGDYNTLGRDFEDRKEEQLAYMIEYAQKINPGKTIQRIDNEDGSVQLTAI